MATINCVIIEDESDAVNLLQHYISTRNDLHLSAVFDSASKAQGFLNENHIDLIFLDIELPGISGIDFLKKAQWKSKVIFTTAFKEYAFDGFELSAIDYLLKPFSYERFSKAISRFQQNPERPSQSAEADNPFIVVLHERRPTKLYLKDILWAEAQRNSLHVGSRSASYKLHMPISEFMEKLPAAMFARVHRSFIVSITEIESISSQKIFIKNKAIPVGRNYAEIVANMKARLAVVNL